MIYLILIVLFILISFYGQYILSRKCRIWTSILLIGIIFVPTVVFLILNYSDAFATVEGLGDFLQNYGSSGVVALVLKTGLTLFPTFIHIAILLFVKHLNKQKANQINKMIASDI